MKVVREGLIFCPTCACAAANDDYSGIESESEANRIKDAIRGFGPHLASGDSLPWTEDTQCDCCFQDFTGEGHVFNILGPDTYQVRGMGVYVFGETEKKRLRVATWSGPAGKALAERTCRLLNQLDTEEYVLVPRDKLQALADKCSDLLDTLTPFEPTDIEAQVESCLHDLLQSIKIGV